MTRGSGSTRSNITRAPRQASNVGANSSTGSVLASAREARNVRAYSASASSSAASPVVDVRAPDCSTRSFAPTRSRASTIVASAAAEPSSSRAATRRVMCSEKLDSPAPPITSGDAPRRGGVVDRRLRLARFLNYADGGERALEEPDGADDEVHGVAEEGGAVALDGVPDELEDPAQYEEPERPAPVPEEERQAHDNHRNADGVRELVQRVLVLRLIVLRERSRHKTSVSD